MKYYSPCSPFGCDIIKKDRIFSDRSDSLDLINANVYIYIYIVVRFDIYVYLHRIYSLFILFSSGRISKRTLIATIKYTYTDIGAYEELIRVVIMYKNTKGIGTVERLAWQGKHSFSLSYITLLTTIFEILSFLFELIESWSIVNAQCTILYIHRQITMLYADYRIYFDETLSWFLANRRRLIDFQYS